MEQYKKYLTPMNLVIAAIVAVVILGGAFYFLNSRTTSVQETNVGITEEESMVEENGDLTEEGGDELVIELSELNSSGQSGVATLTDVGGQTSVVIDLDVASDVSQPAHIHEGVCPGIGPIVYPLTNVVEGYSETLLDVDMESLISQLPLDINVHQSQEQISVYTSCGDL
jgi:hypothetical protein